MLYINNQQLQLANNFIETTSMNVFLTGKAGTGKTTFLHNLKRNSSKRLIVVAPTGVAAINAGGVTIHSFFQLPFGPQIPTHLLGREALEKNDSSNQRINYHKFSREKINIIRSLDLLIIDEISMVRPDLLDGIDGVLRRFKDKTKPFGGVQLLMIGDLHQLAPVVKDDEWGVVRKYYDTIFFFSSLSLQQTNYVSIELTHIYRQSDEVFIDLLNKVRSKSLDENTIDELNKRYINNFNPDKEEGYITLTTHNNQALNINNHRLKDLKGKTFCFKAIIQGEFPEYSYPTEYELELKIGAQVMFVKNDPNYDKLFYNGKIGILESIDEDILFVRCKDNLSPIPVTPLTWHNTKYTLDDDTQEIKETIAGSFTQYPLKLAWAITIHKSQGLTFEKAIIDAQSAFAHGQVYVALSRCKSMEGLVLSSKIVNRAIINDNTINRFCNDVASNQPNQNTLEKAQFIFQKELILELFNFSELYKQINGFIKLLISNGASIEEGLLSTFSSIGNSTRTEVLEVSEKFALQIENIIASTNEIENNDLLNERVKKACEYFGEKLNAFSEIIESQTIDCDNKEIRKNLKEHADRIFSIIHIKIMCLKSCSNGFNVKVYTTARAKASIEKPLRKDSSKKAGDISYSSIKHPTLYNDLKEWREKKAGEMGLSVYDVLPQNIMVMISNALPPNKTALKRIKGFGKKRIEKYSSDILKIILTYCKEKELNVSSGSEFDNQTKELPKEDSKTITFNLFKKGRTIQQIAHERQLSVSTIEDHLTYYIAKEFLSIEELVPPEKIDAITQYFINAENLRLIPAKEALGNSFSYKEIRWVLRYLREKGLIKNELDTH